MILVNQHIKQTNHRNRHHKSKGSRKYIHRPNLQKIDSEPGIANIKPIVEQLKTNGCVTTNSGVTSRIIMMTQRALLVLTSHTELGHTGRGTGFYYDDFLHKLLASACSKTRLGSVESLFGMSASDGSHYWEAGCQSSEIH